MKIVFVLALLVAAAYGQLFCPNAGQKSNCDDRMWGYADKAVCMADNTWVCNVCKAKRYHCSHVKQVALRSRAKCPAATKPNCVKIPDDHL